MKMKKKTGKLTLIAMLAVTLTVLLMLGGCNNNNNENNGTGNGGNVVQTDDTEVARVNDTIITEKQLLDHMMITATLEGGRTFSLFTDEELAALRERTLESIITNTLITQYLREEVGIEGLTPGIMGLAESIASRLRSSIPIEILIANGDIEAENFEEHIEFTQNSNWFFTIVAADLDLSDEVVMEFYYANREDLQRTQVAASHILVNTYAEATDIMRRLDAGEDFGTLARTYSLDRVTAEIDGMIWPDFGRNEVYPAFEAVVFAMEVDEIAGPVRTPFGYHIIRLDGVQRAEPAFGVVRTFIEDYLIRNAANEKLREMRANATIVHAE